LFLAKVTSCSLHKLFSDDDNGACHWKAHQFMSGAQGELKVKELKKRLDGERDLSLHQTTATHLR